MMSDMEVLKRLGLYKKIYDNCQNQERFLYNIEKRKSMCDSSLGYRLAYYIDDLFIWGSSLEGSDFWSGWYSLLLYSSDEEIYKLFTKSIKYNKDLK